MGLFDFVAGLSKRSFGDPPPEPDVTVVSARGAPSTPEQERLGEALASEGNQLQLLVSGHEALPAFLNSIASAKHHIHLQTMLFFDDAAARLVQHALQKKAAEGVAVRVLFEYFTTALGDPFFSKGISPLSVEKLVGELEDAGVEVRDGACFSLQLVDRMELSVIVRSLESMARLEQSAVPVWMRDELATQQMRFIARVREVLTDPRLQQATRGLRDLGESMGPEVERLLSPIRYLRQFLLHDHRKILVVDGRAGMCGGMNVGQEYLYQHPYDPAVPAEEEAKVPGSEEPWEKWRDVHLHVVGPAVNRLQRLFVEGWCRAGGNFAPDDSELGALFPAPDHAGTSRVWVLSTAPGNRNEVENRLIAEIYRAKQTVRVSNPYLIREGVIGSLLGAARRGRRVQLLGADRHNDSFLHRWMARGAQGWYQEAGVEVHEYVNHFTHAKVAVFDEQTALVGSYNFNNRSALLDFECSLLIEDPEFARDVTTRVFDAPIRAEHTRKIESGLDELLDFDRILGAKLLVDSFPDVF